MPRLRSRSDLNLVRLRLPFYRPYTLTCIVRVVLLLYFLYYCALRQLVLEPERHSHTGFGLRALRRPLPHTTFPFLVALGAAFPYSHASYGWCNLTSSCARCCCHVSSGLPHPTGCIPRLHSACAHQTHCYTPVQPSPRPRLHMHTAMPRVPYMPSHHAFWVHLFFHRFFSTVPCTLHAILSAFSITVPPRALHATVPLHVHMLSCIHACRI